MSRSLEDRVRRLEDRAEIEDLVRRYFLATDDDDAETLRGLFAANATFVASGFVGATSRDGIVEWAFSERDSMGTSIHTPESILIDFSDEVCPTGIVGAHFELARGGTTVYGACRYYDEYIFEDGAWRFSKRDLRFFHVGGWSEVAESLTAEARVRWPGLDPLPADLPAAR